MDPHAFIAEVYRRMAARHAAQQPRLGWRGIESDPMVVSSAHQYSPYLPSDRSAAILDLGFGNGAFLAACLKLGYTNLSGADFSIGNKDHIRNWAPDRISLFEINGDIGEFLSDRKERFDFIHLSHVIEHVPKYSLFWVVDSLYWSLKVGGSLLVRTPNMEGPCALSSFYVTMSHEYGFAASNLISLLDMCGFDDVRLLNFRPHARTMKQRLGDFLRWPFLQASRWRHRLFGENVGGELGDEIIMIASRGTWPPYFDRRYR